eukprot:8422887-Pyramimonas_sp.AAC.1
MDFNTAPLRLGAAALALRNPHHLGLRVAYNTLCQILARDFDNIAYLDLCGYSVVSLGHVSGYSVVSLKYISG